MQSDTSFIELVPEALGAVSSDVIETVLGNPPMTWLAAGTAGVASFGVLLLARWLIGRRVKTISERSSSHIGLAIGFALMRTSKLVLVIVSLWIAAFFLELPAAFGVMIGRIAGIALLLQIALWGTVAIRSWREGFEGRTDDGSAITTVRTLTFGGRLVLWAVILLAVLSTLGIEITAMIAGLGIGGIAVALAAQNVLSDLFASLSIVLDKPFVVGDFIIVGDLPGTVQNIGLKTTRLSSLSGEGLVFANSDLLSSRIRNFKEMRRRRIVFSFGVVYQTPADTLERIPAMVREIIEAQEDATCDRAHFKAYGNFSLDFEVVYFVEKPEFAAYMDIQQAVNLAIYRRFEELGIEFAYPTQTLYLDRVRGNGEQPPTDRAEPAAVR